MAAPDRPAAPEEESMSQRFVRRAVPAAVLAASLILALPARAAGPGLWADPPDLFARALQWLAALWPGEEARSVREKAGAGVDPDGSPAPPPPSPTLAPCSEGCGLDGEGGAEG